MMNSNNRLRIALALLVMAAPLASLDAATRSGHLETGLPAAPPATPEVRSGVLQLAGGAYAYLPKGMDGSPRPLLVALYGAGGQASDVLEVYRNYADQNGFVVLIPSSQKGTWDMIEDLKSRLGAEMNVQPRYGKDLMAIDAALADLFTKVSIDPSRVGIAGFSDGATYALSVGTANPQLFRTVIAFSPGPAFTKMYDKAQRVFVSHGENDQVLPYSNARGIVARMRGRGMNVDFESFEGRHEVPMPIRDKAIAFFMARPAP